MNFMSIAEEFLRQYPLSTNIILTIAITLAVYQVYYWLSEKRASSAEKKIKENSEKEIISIIETYYSNSKDVTEFVIETLISSSERKHNINLKGYCSKISILEDVYSNIQSSSHLNIEIKEKYCADIQKLIQQIRGKRAFLYTDEVFDKAKEICDSIKSDATEPTKEKISLSCNNLLDLIRKGERCRQSRNDDEEKGFPVGILMFLLVISSSGWIRQTWPDFSGVIIVLSFPFWYAVLAFLYYVVWGKILFPAFTSSGTRKNRR